MLLSCHPAMVYSYLRYNLNQNVSVPCYLHSILFFSTLEILIVVKRKSSYESFSPKRKL